ncbi:hypothetical protein PVT67_09425 [Gallaecimonas kandeliae]|uniref:hypothetical protein n=1 Tax=Gallaecimonas kandeliae TaxID=3029055 RepID=UPI002647096E|nr:hypothetical protein [Gallaecimonas kandeliae]WKE63920.1 hypothetical protein PVT67_09425 [Gallaecimonas kandeliae]
MNWRFPALLVALLLVGLWWYQQLSPGAKKSPPAPSPVEPPTLPGAASPSATPPLAESAPSRRGQSKEAPPDPMAYLRAKVVELHHDFDPALSLSALEAWPNLDAEQAYRLAEGIQYCLNQPKDVAKPSPGLSQWTARCAGLPGQWRSRDFIEQLQKQSAEGGFLLAQLMLGFELSYQADRAALRGEGSASELRGQSLAWFEKAADQGVIMALAVLASEYADPDSGEFYHPVKALAYLDFLKALLPGFSAPGLEDGIKDLPYYDRDAALAQQAALEAKWQALDQLWR